VAIHTPPEPPQYEPPGDYKNAKAQAKAAKAYAKSQRPWYKKKRFILSGGLVLLVVAVSSGSSGGGGTSDSQSSGSGGSSSDGKSGKVGQALTNAGTTYKVTNVRTTDKIGDPDLGGARADGMFVVVALELTNNKNETKTFLDSSAKIQTSDGKKYETSDKAVLSFGDQSLLLKDIQPDLTTRGKLAFELPASKVNGSTLLLEDLFGSGEIEINLGL
jgi:hypothetical protein